MAFVVKARYYAARDCFDESYVLTSDNRDIDLRLERGVKVKMIVLCGCGKEGFPRTDLGDTSCVKYLCDGCYDREIKKRTL